MFYCRQLKLANYLIKNGATIVEIQQRPKTKFLCFVFAQNETLSRCLTDYKNLVRKEDNAEEK